ncbi:MAG: RDD family protein [Chloroflexota bacterium]
MTHSFDTLKIDTPENVTFDYPVAGIGSRFLAALVDTAIIGILQVIVFGTLLWITALMDTSTSSDGEAFVYWIYGILILLSFVFYWGYYIFFEILWNGQTPGKRLVGLRVLRVDGTPVSASEVVIRNLVRTIDLLPMAYGVGVVTMFISHNSRRLGDLTAGTIVVHEKKTTELQTITTDRQRALGETKTKSTLPLSFPMDRLKVEDVQVIEEYLLRRQELANRHQLAGHILNALLERLGESPADYPIQNSDDMLAAIYLAWKERNSRAE